MKKLSPPFTVDDNTNAFLRGSRFSNYHPFYFERKSFIYNRIELVKSIVEGKSILHFGCCDHDELIEEKIRDNTHLQLVLSGITTKCTGVDINKEALATLERMGIQHCHYYDVYESDNAAIENDTYDYVLLGEILEHIADPVNFLKTLRRKFKNAKSIIITVPNALNSKNFYNIKRGIEEINTDHKYWFTPYTLSKVVTEAGFSMQSVYFVDRSRLNFADRIVKRLFSLLGKDPFTSRKWKVLKSTGLVGIAEF